MSENPNSHFDHEDVVAKIRAEAICGCGSSYEFFSKQFSRAIDSYASALPEGERQAFMTTAKKGGEYMTEAEEKEAFTGCCAHGIDWGFCPAGCDLDDEEV